MAHEVFISYSSKDKTAADAVCAILESECIRCWIAPRDVRAGEEWGDSILNGIKGSRVMVLVLSANANESPHIRREVERAVSLGIAIIPVRIENVMPAKSLELFVTSSHWLDAFNPPLERHLRFLAQVIQKILRGPVAKPEDTTPVQPLVAKEVVAEVLQEAVTAANEMSFHCGHCGQNFKVDKSGAGTTIRCPTCGQPTTIPQAIEPVVQRPAQRLSWGWVAAIGFVSVIVILAFLLMQETRLSSVGKVKPDSAPSIPTAVNSAGSGDFGRALESGSWSWIPGGSARQEQVVFLPGGKVTNTYWVGEWRVTGPLEVTIASPIEQKRRPTWDYHDAVIHFNQKMTEFTGSDFFTRPQDNIGTVRGEKLFAEAGHPPMNADAPAHVLQGLSPGLKEGLILAYDFDEQPVNGVVHDLSGSGNNGHLFGPEWTPQGHHGGALIFGPQNKYVEIANSDSLNPSAITLSVWVKTTRADHFFRRIIEKSFRKGFALSIVGDWEGWKPKTHKRGRITFEVGNKAMESDYPITDGEWHHVAATYDGSIARLFIDGEQQTRTPKWSISIPSNDFPLRLGGFVDPDLVHDDPKASFDGMMDEVRIYNRALSAQEMKELASQQ